MLKPRVSSRDSVLLKFMERTIQNINTCLAGQYTLYKILIEKGVITEDELLHQIKQDKNLPTLKLGIDTLKEMLNPDWDSKIDFEKTEKELLNEALNKISNLVLPTSWKDEGVEPPNSTALRNAHIICHKLYAQRKIIPDVVACTKENGVYLRYSDGDKSLIVEIYNDGEIGTLVNNHSEKEILHNEDISNLNFENSLKVFFK